MKITRTSMITGQTHTLDLPVTEFELTLFQKGMLIQEAFPNLSAGEREFILTGITPEEWQQHLVWPENEEDAP